MSDDKKPDNKNAKDPQQKAMSRQIPASPAVTADDQTTLAMKEDRKGARLNPTDGDQQVKAMSNEFELDNTEIGESDMAKSMRESRVEAKRSSDDSSK